MRRWIWRALLLVLVAAALTGTAWAEEVRRPVSGDNSIVYELTGGVGTVKGPVKKGSIVTAHILAEVNGVKITKINDDAFNGCGKLTSVEIEKGITTIGTSAFNSCQKLQTVFIPEGVSQIGEYAFANCRILNKVVLPTTLTAIETGTFSNCSALSSIYIANTANTENIGDDAFSRTKVKALHCAGKDSLDPTDPTKLPVHHASRTPGGITEPTCTTAGSRVYTYECATCKDSFDFSQKEIIPATGHTQVEQVLIVPATCTKTGTTAGTRCTVCGQPVDGMEEIPVDRKDGHPSDKIIDTPKVEPTCTEDGSQDGKECAACGTVTTEPEKIDKLGHQYEANKKEGTVVIIPASCGNDGEGCEAVFQVCKACGERSACSECKVKIKAIEDAKTNELKAAAQEAFQTHLESDPSHTGSPVLYPVEVKAIEKLGHTWGDAKYVETTPPTCTAVGVETLEKQCKVCDAKATEADFTDEEKKALTRDIPVLGHLRPEDTEFTVTKEPSCRKTDGEGERTYHDYICTRCNQTVSGETEVIPRLDHTPEIPVQETPATCTTAGERITSPTTCKACGEVLQEGEVKKEIIDAKGHTWGNPEPDPANKDKDTAAACGEKGKAHEILTCSDCGATKARIHEIPATGEHKWGDWVTDTTDKTKQVRTCSVCKQTETQAVSSTTPGDDDPTTDKPDDPSTDKPSDADKPEPTTPPTTTPTSYSVSVIQSSNGSVSASRSTAESGDRVTLTAWANSGYELDQIWVTTSGGSARNLTSLGGDQYRFTMPAASVEVRATFSKAASDSGWYTPTQGTSSSSWDGPARPTQVVPGSTPRAVAVGQRFYDVPPYHWAAGEISWANQMGYMNGGWNGFDPDGQITFQQMWMVLARLSGNHPANMEEAKHWAVINGFADGSSPDGAVKRHQLVTALYRCAHMMGRSTRNNATLAGYPDSRTVPSVARDAFVWALANGIIGGNASGRLDPNGTLTRAQFCVILYRYSLRA